MNIKWEALGEVLGIGFVAGTGIVILFSFSLVGLSRVSTARANGGNAISGAVVASVCLAACVAIVAGGLYLIADH